MLGAQTSLHSSGSDFLFSRVGISLGKKYWLFPPMDVHTVSSVGKFTVSS